jgi:NAD(P)-dependent dehydrogenase (short-subunit alcohol dehydrogenase family)
MENAGIARTQEGKPGVHPRGGRAPRAPHPHRALALELAPHGIRVNAVSPGAIETAMTAGASREFLADLQPLGSPGRVSDIVDAVLFLTGAAYVTGEVLHVDGGMTAGRW